MTTTLDNIDKLGEEGKLLPGAVDNLKQWLECDSFPSWVTDSINELISGEKWEELNDRFYQTMAFGTGGMRGRTIGRVSTSIEQGTLGPQETPEHAAIGSNVLNDFNIIRATIGLYRYCDAYLKEKGSSEKAKLVIAHDVRHFSRHFCELSSSTWTKLGGEAFIFDGPRSTPQLSFTVRHTGSTAGIVITASHNPPHDNGFKVYFEDGGQVVSPHAESIIDEVNKVNLSELAEFLNIDISGVNSIDASAEQAYLKTIEEQIIDPDALKQSKAKVVFTAIHGTGGVSSVPAMENMGIEVLQPESQVEFDSRFPTVKSPNPENAEALEIAIKLAEKEGADVVIATDPDADRMGVAVADKSGKMQLLTGNMIGSLMADFRIIKMKEAGLLPEGGTKSAALIKTFVTTPLQEAIAEKNGLKLINTLTGFKWIAEKLRVYEDQLRNSLKEDIDYDNIEHKERFKLLLERSTAYIFGGEESYGYLATDVVRDKDANAAVLIFCELAAWAKAQGITVLEYLDKIYLKYGYYLEGLVNIYFEGAAGAQKISNILSSYRENPPKEINGIEVSKFIDFGREEIKDADGKIIPKQDFYIIELANGYRYAVRGSGTEPKIKFYVFANDDVSDSSELESIKNKTADSLEQLKAAIEKDARERAE